MSSFFFLEENCYKI